MSYNLSAITTNSSLVGITQGVNNHLMYGMLGILFLAFFGLVLLMGFYRSTQDAKRSVASTMFILFIASLMLKVLDLIPDIAIFITLVGFAVSFIFVWRE